MLISFFIFLVVHGQPAPMDLGNISLSYGDFNVHFIGKYSFPEAVDEENVKKVFCCTFVLYFYIYIIR